MPSTAKVQKVAELRGRIEASEALLLTDFEGLTVMDATELRRSLRATGAQFAVVKNTLMQRAAGEVGAAEMEGLLKGPTAVAFVTGDVAAVARSLSEAARRFPRLALKGAYMEGRVLSADEARALADLQPRPVLLARIAGLAKAEMARAARMLQALQGRFLADLAAYQDKLPAAEEAPAPAMQEEMMEVQDGPASGDEVKTELGAASGEEEGSEEADASGEAEGKE
jgi:large subunit ribosomal protein L10